MIIEVDLLNLSIVELSVAEGLPIGKLDDKKKQEKKKKPKKHHHHKKNKKLHETSQSLAESSMADALHSSSQSSLQ
jgi:hypothetical protein